jgi:hypothetical protein
MRKLGKNSERGLPAVNFSQPTDNQGMFSYAEYFYGERIDIG